MPRKPANVSTYTFFMTYLTDVMLKHTNFRLYGIFFFFFAFCFFGSFCKILVAFASTASGKK